MDLRSKRKASVSEPGVETIPPPEVKKGSKKLTAPSAQQVRPVKRSRTNLRQDAAKERLAEKARVQAEKEAQDTADIKAIANIEDQVRREQKEERLHAERPDLRTFENLQKTPPPTDNLDDMDIDFRAASDDADNIPEDTDSDGLALGEHISGQSDSDLGSNKSTYHPSPGHSESGTGEFIGEENNTSDAFISDDENRAVYLQLKESIAKKKKAKRVKGAIRNTVNEKRKVRPCAPFRAKSAADMVDEEEEAVETAAKKKNPLEGFRKDFNKPTKVNSAPRPRAEHPTTSKSKGGELPTRQSKAALGRNVTVSTSSGKANPTPTVHVAASKVPEGHNDEAKVELAGFEDEGSVAIAAARSSKATVLSQKSGTSNMGIKTEKVNISDKVKKDAVPSKKPNISTKDLPFSNVPDGVDRWRREVMPMVYAWACTVVDPFAINSDPAFEGVVRDAWEDVFDGEAEFTPEVLQVAGVAIRTWRSSLGKLAIEVIKKHFRSDPQLRSKGARVEFVREQLNECQYIYEDAANLGGAYRAPLLLEVYAYHQAKLELTDAFYGHPVGALAFAATALERALKLWKSGTLVDPNERKNFVSRPWGARVQYHIGQLGPFSDSRWAKIENAARPFLKAARDFKEDDIDDNDEGINLGPNVVIHLSASEDGGDSDISKDL